MSDEFSSVVDYNTDKYDNLIISTKTNDLGGNSAVYVSKAVGGKGKSKKTSKNNKKAPKKTSKNNKKAPKKTATKKCRFFFF
jgi:hypothetical protein